MAFPSGVAPPTPTFNTSGGVRPNAEAPNAEHVVLPWWNEGASKETVRHEEQHAEAGDTGHARPPSVSKFEDVDCASWQNAPNTKCHASFGDQGMTATVGAFGQLLQFSKFLGGGSSGMFSADHVGMSEPFFVTHRARELYELSQQSFHYGPGIGHDQPYGLRFPGLVLKPEAEPKLKWTHWRWPRHEYSRGDFENYPTLKLTVQWMIHKKKILQQCFLEYDGQESIQFDVEFSKSMMIRDLDHIDSRLHFNEEETKNHDSEPGPQGHSWVCVHKFNTKTAPEDLVKDVSGPCKAVEDDVHHDLSNRSIHSVAEKSSQPEKGIRDRETEFKNCYGVSVTASVAINGKLEEFKSENPQRWQGWTAPIDDLRTSGAHHAQALEVTVAYDMNLAKTGDIGSQAHGIARRDMRVSEVLREQRSTQSPSFCVRWPLEEPDTAQRKEDIWNISSVKGSKEVSIPKQNEIDETIRPQTHDAVLKQPVHNPGISPPQHKPDSLHRYLYFAARRHLEHILSVCAIQAIPYLPQGDVTFPNGLHSVKAVALTCGDMSGHKICWSASFFAFEFLVEFYTSWRDHLSKQDLDRIRWTCLGHLKWLHLVQQKKCGQRFGSQYWVTGRLMDKTSGTSRVPEESLLNTAFQILKAAACMELWPDQESTAELMSDWTPPWLLSMEKLDRRKKYAWPHAKDYGVNIFRLDEHVWIWRALKALESSNHRVWNRVSKRESSQSPTPLLSDAIENLRKVFASNLVQDEVSKRFTTFNDVLEERMLAVARSARETRFMLHAHDTALFYSAASKFFSEDTSVKDLWERTIRCQMYHEENKDLIWEKSMRYALCIMMGIQDLRINGKPTGELVRTATDTLISSSSPNGFFPGQLQFFMNQPRQKPFPSGKDRDLYYHASFEIPFILLAHANKVSDLYNQSTSDLTNSTSKLQARPGHNLQRSNSLQSFPKSQSDVILFPDDTDQRRIRQKAFRDVRRSMKKCLPLNNLIDYSNIVKLEDEWLFEYPEFFTREEHLKADDYKEALAELWRTKCRIAPKLTNSVSDNHDRYRSFVEAMGLSPRKESFNIVDVPSSKLIMGKRKNRQPTFEIGFDHHDLWEVLRPARTARDSKKRLLFFYKATREIASVCYAATELCERDDLLDFFEKHARYEKHVTDQCNMLHNTWETELHLSYYQLVEGFTDPRPGIPTAESKPFPGSCEKQIFRVSASFRFKGDFFDRYWTGYMLEYSHNEAISKHDLLQDKEHRQRRVLEQRYFADILTNLVANTRDILTEVEQCLDFQSGSFTTSISSTKAYLSWSSLWKRFEPLLQELDGDLRSTQVTVEHWRTREDDRGPEKPQWTLDDEKKYRAMITKNGRRIKHQTIKLQQLHADINLLRESCSTRLDRAREELSFRSEQNIATFTYVTVVFLPLGFAASIFSMSETPGKALVGNMAIASVIALAVTIIALTNAKGLVDGFKDLTANAKNTSLMLRDLENTETVGIAPNARGPGQPPLRDSLVDTAQWSSVFWTRYIFIELPARSITAACRTLGCLRNDDEDLEDSEESKRMPLFERGAVALQEKEAAAVSGRPSMQPRHKPAAQLIAARNLSKDGSAKNVARVLLGFLAIPFFLPFWVLQVLCFYAWDVLALLGEALRRGIRHVPFSDSYGPESRLMAHLTKPPEKLRLIKRFKNHIWPNQEPLQSPASDKTGGREGVISPPENTSQAPQ